jgi:hypothetical protein
MAVTYAILPNVRHGCDLTRPAGRPPRLPACFTTCNDNDLAPSYVLGELVGICGLRHHVILLSRHPASTCRDGLFGACSTRRVKKSARHPSLVSTPTRAYAQQTHRIAALVHRPIASEFASLHRGHWASSLRAQFIRPFNFTFSET